MSGSTRRRSSRRMWVYTAFLLGLLHSIVFSDDPVCLEKSEGTGGTAFVVFSPDGKWLAAMLNEEVLVWDFATKEKVATKPYQFAKSYDNGFRSIAFSPDSQGLFYLGDACRVCLWDGSDGWADAPEREILGRLIGPDGSPLPSGGNAGDNMAVSPDGKTLAVQRGRGVIKIIELDTGKEVGELVVPRTVNSLQLANQGKVLMVGVPGSVRDRPLVQFWNVETLTEEEPLHVQLPARVKRGCVVEAVLSPAEDMVAVVAGDSHIACDVRLHELPSRRWATLASNPRFMLFSSFSPDGRLLAVPTHHGPGDPAAVLVWDLTAKSWRRFDCPSKIAQQNIAFWNAKFSPDGRYLAGGLTHPQVAVCIWDLQGDGDESESSGTSSGFK